MRRLWLGISGVLFLLGSAAAAVAQTVTVSPDRAGRISYVEGSVSVRGADQDQWSPAGVNWPVTSGTAVWTQPGARAEIQVGPAELRIDQNTELDVTRLDDGVTALSVPQGVANIHISAEGGAPIQVDTANGPVTLNRPGFYHVENGVVAAADTSATPFDRWAMSRAQQATVVSSDTLRYVSPQTTGYQDLGAYGSWTVTPDYGAIWYPRVVPGWAPYRYGHWAYVTPWGWTWVDAAPWGFTPFHYGRWVQVHDRWAWWPGQRVVRPIYTPALVVFVGGGGFHDRHRPPARWIPLAPRESVHVNVNVNVNVVNVDRFANRHAVSSLPRSTFDRDGRPGHDRPGPWTRDHDAAASPAFHREGREMSRPDTAVSQRSDARPVPSDPARRNQGPDRTGQDRRNAVETRATPLPAAIAPAATPQADAPRPGARPETHAAPQPRAIAPAATPQADAPRPSVRPETPATWRRNRPEEHRNPPETRIAPPTTAPSVRPYMAPPQTRDAAREQPRGPARAEAAPVTPQPRREPAVQGNWQRHAPSPQVVAPASQPQAAPRREAAAGPRPMPPQAPAQLRAAPQQPAQAQSAPATREQRHPERNQEKRDDR